MTEDEAFIRAIVDSPGDEGPRLVYADWLEERGDPRSKFLRPLQQPVRTGDIEEWERLEAELDPVWVARVSLPPFGVCCEHVEFLERGPVLADQQINEFERRFGLTLPHDYRAFLLNYNGGIVPEVQLQTPDGKLFKWRHSLTFFHLDVEAKRKEKHSLDWYADSRAEDIARNEPNPRLQDRLLCFIEVGEDDSGNALMLGVAGPNFGAVWSFDYRLRNVAAFETVAEIEFAPSFAGYLDTLPSRHPSGLK
jgi:uncharacterized protein (TIGR02996 family)